jgi:hypothetical protein
MRYRSFERSRIDNGLFNDFCKTHTLPLCIASQASQAALVVNLRSSQAGLVDGMNKILIHRAVEWMDHFQPSTWYNLIV